MGRILLCHFDLSDQPPFDRYLSTRDLLASAEGNLAGGLFRFAAGDARSVVELTLNALCYLEGCHPRQLSGGRGRRPTTHDMLNCLKLARRIGHVQFKSLSHTLAVGNYAAHGGDVPLKLAVRAVTVARELRDRLGGADVKNPRRLNLPR